VQGDIDACPIVAVMVAMAHARPASLGRMLAHQAALVLSRRREDPILRYPSGYYYDVVFPGRGSPTRITPWVYFNDQQVQYASTPGGAGWPSYIEKAYAVWKSRGGREEYGGDYTRLSSNSLGGPPTLNDVIRDLIGKFDALDLNNNQFIDSHGNPRAVAPGDIAGEIAAMAGRARRRPTVAPSIPNGAEQFKIVSHHGYAVLGFRNGVRLRNPWGGERALSTISVADFRKAFQGIWQAV
jgi:hypothetical protein